jgi:hypothetical protein
MGSGNPRIVINNLERAVSTDHNRAQSFLAKDSHEFARHLVNREISGDFYNFPGLQAPYTALPPSSDFLIPHDCISGLMVRPDNPTGLLIDPGVAAFFVPAFPNATADDSKYIYVSDPGVSSLGMLTFTTNAGPGVRWDIIECQPTESLIENTSRDVYNPATGQFTNGSIAKVRAGTLTYRVRSGSAGGGIPNPDSEWLPLAAVHVRADATGYSNCDVYDIRPLVNERCPWSPNSFAALPIPGSSVPGYRLELYEAEFAFAPTTAGVNGKALGGYFRSHYGGYWSGGALRRNTPATNLADFGAVTGSGGSFPYFNPQDGQNRSSAYSIAGDDRFLVGAFFPRGYPRWVRYSQAALSPSAANRLRKTGRLPQGPRGILWITKDVVFGNGVINAVPAPTALGETVDCMGHAVVEGFTNGTTEFYPAIGGTHDRKFSLPIFQATTPSVGSVSLAAPVTSLFNIAGSVFVQGALAAARITFTPTYPEVPPYARAVQLRVRFSINYANGSPTPILSVGATANVGSPDKAYQIEHEALSGMTRDNGGGTEVFEYDGTIWVPLPANALWDESDIPGPSPLNITYVIGSTVVSTGGTASATVVGYQI